MPLLIGAAVVVGAFLFLNSKKAPNPFKPGQVAPTAPGPAAQQSNTTPFDGILGHDLAKGTGNVGSPNSTLTTINNSLVVANNALGLFDKVSDYFGDNSDSEYPVGNTDSPVESAPNMTFGSDSYTDDNFYT